MNAPATCRHCGEQAGSTGSLSGLVHRWGPKDHRFEPLPTAEQSNAVVERMIAAETTILSTPATHPCDACGGTGCPCGDWLASDGACRCATPCPVCLGAGSFSDRMPAADALADAETLRMVAREVWTYGAGVYALRKYAMALVVGGMGRPLFKTREERNRNIATHRARAAFRAVPGLRED